MGGFNLAKMKKVEKDNAVNVSEISLLCDVYANEE